MPRSTTVRRTAAALATAVVPALLTVTPAVAATSTTTTSGTVFAQWTDNTAQKGFGNRHVVSVGASTVDGVTTVFGSIDDYSCKSAVCDHVATRYFVPPTSTQLTIDSSMQTARLAGSVATSVQTVRKGMVENTPGAQVTIDVTWTVSGAVTVASTETRSKSVTTSHTTYDSAATVSGSVADLQATVATSGFASMNLAADTVTDRSSN